MGRLAALKNQLAFIRSFYLTAATPFDGLLRKHNPLNASSEDLRPYEEERWKEAIKGLEVLGQCSLSLVSKAIQDYLREVVGSGINHFRKKAKESWFDRYCCFLEENTSFRWADSPLARDLIEQINLCRNDFQHDPEIDGSQPQKDLRHFEKHPRSRFDDPLERAVKTAYAQVNGEEPRDTPGSLTVTRIELFKAVSDAGTFCEFVETQTFSKPQPS